MRAEGCVTTQPPLWPRLSCLGRGPRHGHRGVLRPAAGPAVSAHGGEQRADLVEQLRIGRLGGPGDVAAYLLFGGHADEGRADAGMPRRELQGELLEAAAARGAELRGARAELEQL